MDCASCNTHRRCARIRKTKYIYDRWDDAVNMASRMESGGMPGTIQVTRSVYDKLKDRFAFEPRGQIDIKGRSGGSSFLFICARRGSLAPNAAVVRCHVLRPVNVAPGDGSDCREPRTVASR